MPTATTSPAATPLVALDAIVLDTETTGLDPANARIVQIGAVRLAKGTLAGTLIDTLVDPGIAIPPASTRIHGIDASRLAGAPAFEGLAGRLAAEFGQTVLIGHNVSFDMAVIAAEFARTGTPWRPAATLDTLLLARAADPTLADYSLEALAAWLGVEPGQRHSALGDAQTTARIFLALLARLRERSIRTLGEADSLCRGTAADMLAHGRPGVHPQAADGPARQAGPEPATARIDAYPYSHRVGAVIAGAPVIVPAAMTIAETARLIGARGISSAFVGTGASDPDLGIVTERDLMRALAKGAGTDRDRVDSIASRPLVTVPGDAFLYRALALMSRKRIRHLGVRNRAGTLIGALTTGDLLRQRANAALVMGDEIDMAPDAASLAAIWARLPTVAASMLAEGITATDITAVIAEELGAMTRRAGELARHAMQVEGLGPPPADFALLILGSGGRGETRLAGDQDNALVHAAAEDNPACAAWFSEFGARLATILDTAGIPFCKGGVMAREPAWRHGMDGWKRQIADWVARYDPKSLLNVDIFFDFRPVLGGAGLAAALEDFAHATARASRGFLSHLAASTTERRTAFTLLGSIATRDGRIDLKLNGLFAIVGAARILAIRNDIRARGTIERLRALAALDVYNGAELDALVAAHEIVSREILRQQVDDSAAGIALSTSVAVNRLSRRELADLKWALRQSEIARLLVAPL